MIYFGIEVVRSAREHDAVPAFFFYQFEYALALGSRPGAERFLFGVSLFDRRAYLGRRYAFELLAKPLRHAVGVVEGQEQRGERYALGDELVAHVLTYDFGIRPDDRAVVVVVRVGIFLPLVRQAGIENELYSAVYKRLDMPVRYFCGIAYRFGRHRFDALGINVARRPRRQLYRIPELGEEGEPERIVFVQVEHARYADRAARSFVLGQRAVVRKQPLVLALKHIGRLFLRLFGRIAAAFATVV